MILEGVCESLDLAEKIRRLLTIRGMTAGQLARSTGISRATMSRVMKKDHDHRISEGNLLKIANALDVSPLYLRGGYRVPGHISEEDILFLADLRNKRYIKLVSEIARKGITAEDLKILINILIS